MTNVGLPSNRTDDKNDSHGTIHSDNQQNTHTSYWQESVQLPRFTSLDTDLNTEIIVVGGGITGITCAYHLAREGAKVVLLEADTVLSGTTAHTTAKVTAQHGLIYDELLQHMGEEQAQLYYQANHQALNFIRHTIAQQNIDCRLESQNAYLYATTNAGGQSLEREHAAYKLLGIRSNLTTDIPFPIETTATLMMADQAQFHPLQYLSALLSQVLEHGGQVFEHTVAVDIEDSAHPTVITADGHRIVGQQVVICTHFPFYGAAGLYFTRMSAQRAYVIAVKSQQAYPGGMYLQVESPTRSLRAVGAEHDELVLVTGENHKAGQGEDSKHHYQALETFAQNALGRYDIRYRWSAQDLTTVDKIPYIGAVTASHAHVFVATGYRKWGMTTGTAAGKLLADKILQRANPFEELFSPSRFYVDPSIKTFLNENLNVAGEFLKGKLRTEPQRVASDLTVGQGGEVRHRGRRAGAYRNNAGELAILDTTCTHLGCEVIWNEGDKTWDCPCHGSRFLPDGQVMEGPARHPLARLE